MLRFILVGLCMFLGCLIYPAGWDNGEVQRICGRDADSYRIGNVHLEFILNMSKKNPSL